MKRHDGGVVVAGLGSEYRRDDGAGIVVAGIVAARLAGSRRAPAVDVGPLGEPLDLLGRWDGARLAVVVDAVSSGAAPGTVRVVELEVDDGAGGVGPPPDAAARRGPGPAPPPGPHAGPSSHGIGLVGVLRLARTLGAGPGRVVAVAIEGGDFSRGAGLTPPVAAAIPTAVAAVLDVVGVGVGDRSGSPPLTSGGRTPAAR